MIWSWDKMPFLFDSLIDLNWSPRDENWFHSLLMSLSIKASNIGLCWTKFGKLQRRQPLWSHKKQVWNFLGHLIDILVMQSPLVVVSRKILIPTWNRFQSLSFSHLRSWIDFNLPLKLNPRFLVYVPLKTIKVAVCLNLGVDYQRFT